MIPNTKVFVGSLPPGAKPAELRRLFENFGVVTECDIMNRCGFVHMESAEVAEKAIQGLHNSYFMGQAISVEPGRMKERRPAGGSGGHDSNRSSSGGAGERGRGSGYSNRGENFSNGYHKGASSRTASNNIDLGGGAPIRRSHHQGAPARNTPYQRYGSSHHNGGGGGGGYDRRPANGGYHGGRSPATVPDSYGSPVGSSRYHNSGYGSGYTMGSQDRRGFALPDRQTDEYAGAPMYNEHYSAGSGAIGSRGAYGPPPPHSSSGGYRADSDTSYGQHRRTPSSNSYYANGDHYGQPSNNHYQGYDQGYSASSAAPPVDTYARRPASSAEGSNGSSSSYGPSSYGSSSVYNQDFPPLGSSSSMSRSYGNGHPPQRRDAPHNPRY